MAKTAVAVTGDVVAGVVAVAGAVGALPITFLKGTLLQAKSPAAACASAFGNLRIGFP